MGDEASVNDAGVGPHETDLAAILRWVVSRHAALKLPGRLFLPAWLVRPDLAVVIGRHAESAGVRWNNVVAVVSPLDLEPGSAVDLALLGRQEIALALVLDADPIGSRDVWRLARPEFLMLSAAADTAEQALGGWADALAAELGAVSLVTHCGDAELSFELPGIDGVVPLAEAFRYPPLAFRADSSTREEPLSPATPILQLALDRAFLGVDTPIAQVVEQLQATNLHALPVVDAGRLLGLVRGINVLARFVNGGCDLATRAAEVLELDFEPVAADASLESLKTRLDEAAFAVSGDPIIVVDAREQYLGLLRPEQLARQIAELEVHGARYMNPLTRLPGAVPLNEHIRRLLQAGGLFVVAHFDIEGIKTFNDHFGYARGDAVIRFVAELLARNVERGADYLAHIGGDDFVVVFRSPDWFDCCEAILRECEAAAPGFYGDGEREAHGVYRVNHLGAREFHPYFSLSVGAVPVEPGKFFNHHAIVTASAEVKLRAKSTRGGAIYLDERAHLDQWGASSKRHN